MGLTKEKALNSVIALYNECFEANALCDRISYVISVEKNLVRFGSWFHKNIAHAFAGDGFADGIEDFAVKRGDLFYRGEVKRHDEKWELISDAIKDAVMACERIENKCSVAIHDCADEGSEAFEDFLRELNVKSIAPMLHQLIVFQRAIADYESMGCVAKWNNDFDSYIVTEFRK